MIDLSEAQLRTVVHVHQVVDGTQELEFRVAEFNEGQCRWIGEVLQRPGYRHSGVGVWVPTGGLGQHCTLLAVAVATAQVGQVGDRERAQALEPDSAKTSR